MNGGGEVRCDQQAVKISKTVLLRSKSWLCNNPIFCIL